MYIHELRLKNLRCFVDTSLKLGSADRPLEPQESIVDNEADTRKLANINLIIGDNGAGKSSILRGVALTALAQIMESSGYYPYSMVRRASARKRKSYPPAELEGTLRLHEQDAPEMAAEDVVSRLKIHRRNTSERLEVEHDASDFWSGMFDDESDAFLVLGYGATRRVEENNNVDFSGRKRGRQLRYQRVSSLFEEHMTLIPLGSWLPKYEKQNKGRWTQVVRLIDRLLPDEASFQGKFVEGEYQFKHQGRPVSFSAMSDGYRSYIGWVGDMLYHICMGCPDGVKLIENKGIVLLDEVDLHLHPRWQRDIVPTLARELPNIQFLLTTHSPLVVGTLRSENIHVLVETDEGVKATRLTSQVHGLNADQLLTSDLFGLASSRSPDFVKKLTKVSAEVQKGNTEAEALFNQMLLHGSQLKGIDEVINQTPSDRAKAAAKKLGGKMNKRGSRTTKKGGALKMSDVLKSKS